MRLQVAYTYPGTLAVTRITLNHMDFLQNAHREKEVSKRFKTMRVYPLRDSNKDNLTVQFQRPKMSKGDISWLKKIARAGRAEEKVM